MSKRLYQFDFSKYTYSVDDEKNDFRVYRYNEDITDRVMNNPLLDLLIAYDSLKANVDRMQRILPEELSNKHGEWVELYNYPDEWDDCHWVFKCSLCEYHTESLEDYCPNCGAKMTE